MELGTDIDDDTHFCLKCRSTITGLENYVRHRKTGCGTAVPGAEDVKVVDVAPEPLQEQPDPSLKADDFFSSLELQSSSKKSSGTLSGTVPKARVVTRSRATAAFAGTMGRDTQQPLTIHQKSDSDHGLHTVLSASGGLMSPKKAEDGEAVMNDFLCGDESNDEYEEDFEELEDDEGGPPRSHTGGKWRPEGLLSSWGLLLDDCGSSPPPPGYTGGKWRPTLPPQHHHQPPPQQSPALPPPPPPPAPLQPHLQTQQVSDDPAQTRVSDDPLYGGEQPMHGVHSEEEDDPSESRAPPPDHTSGKWVPGRRGALRKSGSTVQYWCGACNRRLSSRTMFERHLLSELHFKRTALECELDGHPAQPPSPGPPKRAIKRTETYLNSDLWSRAKKLRLCSEKVTESTEKPSSSGSLKKRRRRKSKVEIRCGVCRTKVQAHLMGKHLVSHFHWRKARAGDPSAQQLVLDHIGSVVRQAPFQCGPCKFYCNSSDTFSRHWHSPEHALADAKMTGRYWCSFCKFDCQLSSEMEAHLEGIGHRELVAVINRSVPIIIRKRLLPKCWTCGVEFRYNIQFLRHRKRTGHADNHEDQQASLPCEQCAFVGHSAIALQRHVLKTHRKEASSTDGSKGVYFCSACSLNFTSAEEALVHRRSQEHKYTALAKRSDRGLLSKSLTKLCPHCGEQVANVPLLKEHLQEKHPELPYMCTMCGMAFPLHQEVSHHVREKACVFQQPDEPSKDGALFCRHCPYRSMSQAELLFHETLHDDPVLVLAPDTDAEAGQDAQQIAKYHCPMCNKLFKKHILRCHLRTHTGERPFMCIICDRSFGHRSSLITHMKKSHRRSGLGFGDEEEVLQQDISCDKCPFRSDNKISAGRHRLTHTERNKTFLCAVCGNSFFLKSTLQQHMKLHTGKDFKCQEPNCIFTCRSKAELRNHNNVHSDKRPYHCQTCVYSAKTKPQLLRHNKIHLGEKPHQCPHCSFTARMSSHLRRHLRLHTGAKPYRCPYCPYTCNILENLRKHVLCTSKHPGKKLYECKFCPDDPTPYSSNLAREFRAHLVTAHSDRFHTVSLAASYVTGIYDAHDDPKHIDNPIQLPPRWRRNKNVLHDREILSNPPENVNVKPSTEDNQELLIYIQIPSDTGHEEEALFPATRDVNSTIMLPVGVQYIHEEDSMVVIRQPEEPPVITISPSSHGDDYRHCGDEERINDCMVVLRQPEEVPSVITISPTPHTSEYLNSERKEEGNSGHMVIIRQQEEVATISPSHDDIAELQEATSVITVPATDREDIMSADEVSSLRHSQENSATQQGLMTTSCMDSTDYANSLKDHDSIAHRLDVQREEAPTSNSVEEGGRVVVIRPPQTDATVSEISRHAEDMDDMHHSQRYLVIFK